MPQKDQDAFNVYELMENDKGEVMVLIYARDTSPQNSTFFINVSQRCIEISRNKDDTIFIDGLQDESIIKLQALKTLYVCEIKYTEKSDEDNEIVYAYMAECKKPKSAEKTAKQKLVEKAKNINQKIKKKPE